MHACIHTHIHTYRHTHIHTYVHTYMCVCTYVCAHTHTDTRHTCLLRTHLVIICIFAVARTMSGVGLDVSDVEASFIAEFWCFSLRGRRGQFQLGGGMQIESTSAKVFRPPKLKDGMPSRTHMKSQGAQKASQVYAVCQPLWQKNDRQNERIASQGHTEIMMLMWRRFFI